MYTYRSRYKAKLIEIISNMQKHVSNKSYEINVDLDFQTNPKKWR